MEIGIVNSFKFPVTGWILAEKREEGGRGGGGGGMYLSFGAGWLSPEGKQTGIK